MSQNAKNRRTQSPVPLFPPSAATEQNRRVSVCVLRRPPFLSSLSSSPKLSLLSITVLHLFLSLLCRLVKKEKGYMYVIVSSVLSATLSPSQRRRIRALFLLSQILFFLFSSLCFRSCASSPLSLPHVSKILCRIWLFDYVVLEGVWQAGGGCLCRDDSEEGTRE